MSERILYRVIPYKCPLPNKRPHHFMTLANSIDPDETAPMGAVSSGSTLFAYTKIKVLTIFCINTTNLKCNAP